MGSARPLAQVYRRFAEADHPDASPLYKRVALALSESGEALRAIEAAPARKRKPAVILAALHDLALAGRAPALAAAYAAADGDAAAGAAIDTLLRMTDAVADIAVRRPVRGRRDRTPRRALPGHRRGGPPGRRDDRRADRRRPFGRAQPQRRSRRHHLQQRAIAGRPVLSRAGVVLGSRKPGPSRRGRCPRSSPGSASTSIRSTSPTRTTPAGCAPACRRISPSGPRGSTRRWRWRRRPLRCCCEATPSSCCPTPSPASPPTRCPSSPRPGRCRSSRSRPASVSCAA